MIILQRLQSEVLTTQDLQDRSPRTLRNDLFTCLEIAQSIQAHQESIRLIQLHSSLMKTLYHLESCPPPHTRYLQVFSQIASIIDRHLGKEDFLDQILDIVIRTTDAERGALFLDTPQGVEFLAGRDLDHTTLTDATELSITAIQNVHTNEIVFSHNALDDPAFNMKKSVVLNKIRSLLCIPLMIDTHMIGALYLDSRFQDKTFSQQDKDFIL